MNRPTCIVVVGLHRSGTSALAGVLFHLGVHMGNRLMKPTEHNPRGHFEDLDFLALNNVILHGKANSNLYTKPRLVPPTPEQHGAFQTLVDRRCAQYEVWGVKDPRFCLTLFDLFRHIHKKADLRMLYVRRHPNAIHASLMDRDEKYGLTAKDAWDVIETYAAGLRKLKGALKDRPSLEVHYDQLLADPERWVRRIASLASSGLPDWQQEWRIEKATKFIEPSLRHWRADVY